MKIFLSIILILFTNLILTKSQNFYPIIGIFTIPIEFGHYDNKTTSELSAGYIKFLESGGSRVIHIYHNGTQEYYDFIFESVNGILFTGGYTPFFVDEKPTLFL